MNSDLSCTSVRVVCRFRAGVNYGPKSADKSRVWSEHQPLGVEPGKTFDAVKAAKLDGALFREVAADVAKQVLAGQADPALLAHVAPLMFMPKGQIDLETEVAQSVIGPIGQPGYQARYIPVATKDGKPMDALHDYCCGCPRTSYRRLPPSGH